MDKWDTFLQQVDDNPDDELIKTTQDFLVALGFRTPATAVGVQHQKVLSSSQFPAELPKQAFINRALSAIEATHKALTSAKGPLSYSLPSQPLQSHGHV